MSTRWIRAAGLAASLSVVWATFVPCGFPWLGLVWLSLAFSGALWLHKSSTRSIAQVIHLVEGERVRAVAASGPVAMTVPKAVP